MGAEAFRNVPFEEFYDLQIDPYEMKNLIHNKKYKNQIYKLKKQLKKWMTSQSDFLLETEIPFGPHLVMGCILYVVLIDQIFDFLI